MAKELIENEDCKNLSFLYFDQIIFDKYFIYLNGEAYSRATISSALSDFDTIGADEIEIECEICYLFVYLINQAGFDFLSLENQTLKLNSSMSSSFISPEEELLEYLHTHCIRSENGSFTNLKRKKKRVTR